jgi:hypothetical protein
MTTRGTLCADIGLLVVAASIAASVAADKLAAGRPVGQPDGWRLSWQVVLGGAFVALALLDAMAFMVASFVRRRRARAAGLGNDKAA